GIPTLARGDSQLPTPRSVVKRAAKAVLYPPFLRLFDSALYVGQRSQSYWIHYRYPETRLFFSPHCVDVDWFAARATEAARAVLRDQLGIGIDTKILLFSGKLMKFKRPGDLVHTAAQLRRGGRCVVVMIAGSGPLESELGAAARATGVPLHLLGFCNQ